MQFYLLCHDFLTPKDLLIFNRPGVAGAVLQTALLLSKVSKLWFVEIYSNKWHQEETSTARWGINTLRYRLNPLNANQLQNSASYSPY